MPRRSRSTTGEAERRRRAAAQRERRRRMNEEEVEALRRDETERQRRRRAEETEEESSTRRAIHAAEDRERRRMMSQEEMELHRTADAERHRERRAEETEEESSARRTVHAVQEMERVRTMNEEEMEAHRAADAEGRRVSRAVESLEEREQRLRRERRRRRRSELRNAGRSTGFVSVDAHSCGSMEASCNLCGGLFFEGERTARGGYGKCCHGGKIVEQERTYPDVIRQLFSGTHEFSQDFFQEIRRYNSALSFASMGANVDPPPGSGPYCFRIHGGIYHLTSHLRPSVPGREKYAQLYILDSEEALRQRMNMMRDVSLNRDLLILLDEVLRSVNPYAEAYKMMREFEEEATRVQGAPAEIRMYIRGIESGPDRGRYSAPRGNEIAAIFQSADGAAPSNRDIVVHSRGGRLIRLDAINPNVEPMTYALFFPCGERGFFQGAPFTELELYSHRVSVRRGIFNPIILGRKLFQQYIVDSYVKYEAGRMSWYRRNQSRLRVENYMGLSDHVYRRAEDMGARCGVPVVLPSNFIGSPRAMHQNYQDAMAVVRDFGKPDLFVTFTCNPKWPEITASLAEGQKAHDRPDVVARVFDIKKQALLDDITTNHVLGTTVAHIHVVEFQKRGLPHMHLLVILDDEDKIQDSEDIDKLVRAEIPDEVEDPVLHGVVRRSMIHGPCGDLDRNSPCMVDGVCTKGFPKEFEDSTEANVGGYPRYRRRDDGRFLMVRNRMVDNRWVVPYNAYLAKKYDAHINVEICSSVKSVKYLFKYVYKGHDAARVVLEDSGGTAMSWDEITTYLNARYVSAPEGMWRLLEKEMDRKSHTVERLPVHLEDMQPVYFQDNEERNALERASRRNTKLTGWFELNRRDPEANSYVYGEIAKYYTWNEQTTTWNRRQRNVGCVISRMFSVSPKDVERFHLRLLLCHVRGARSFEEMRTFNGVVYQTYKEACRARDLLQDDAEWKNCMKEAVSFKMPYELRQLFCFICVFCNPTEPATLWEEFKKDMSEDFARTYSEEDSFDLALRSLEELLSMHRVSLRDLSLPQPSANVPVPPSSAQVYDVREERQQAERFLEMLNPQQRIVYDAVLESVQEEGQARPRMFFVDAFAGAGKTFLFKTILHAVRGLGLIALPVAWTGIASVLLEGGRTVHSTFKLPVPVLENSTCHVTQDSPDGRTLVDAQLIVWDECTMTPRYALEAVDRLLRDLTRIDVPFGGKTVLLGGDWRQTLPVIRKGNRTSIFEICLRNSPLWGRFNKFTLTSNMRLGSGEQEFSQWLMELGDGRLHTDGRFEEDVVEVPQECVAEGSIVDEIFPPNYLRPEDLADRAILCPKNEDALKINEEILRRFPGCVKTFYSADSIVCEDPEEQDTYQMDFVNSLTPSGMPPHRLNLKVGSIIMLLRNLHPSMGLCNGTRLIVKTMQRNVLDCQVITGKNAGSRVFIPRINLSPSDANLPFELRRRQFPVRLSFAMTINKAQGQTLRNVGIFLPQPVFGHGMLYVAFSRCTSMNRIRVSVVDTNRQGRLIENSTSVFTKNVVYREVLE